MVEAAARAGYDYVGLRLLPVTEEETPYRLDRDRALLRRTKRALAATGLHVLDIELCKLEAGTDVRDFQSALEAGAELGARHVIAGAMDGNVERLALHLAQLCDLAAPLGLSVNLEPVSFFPIAGIADGAEVVRRADRANAGLLVDTLHFSRSHDSLAALAALPRPWFHFAQLSDAPRETPRTREGLIHAARRDRRYLGEGGLDIRGILAALPPVPYALEIPNEAAVAAHSLQEHIDRCLATARAFLDGTPRPAQRGHRSAA
jgi:sugar phosphate isomerase/epimerase